MSLPQDEMFDFEIELEEDNEILESEWPKTVKTYLHGNKEYGSLLGEEIGLEGSALEEFAYLHYEVELTIEVNKDGSYTIIAVDGTPVGDYN